MALNPDLSPELRKRFRGDIRQDLASKLLYSTDASIYQIGARRRADSPNARRSTNRGGVGCRAPGARRCTRRGTSLAGQAIGDGLILDRSRWLDRILEIDPERRTATVEPGVILADLNRAAACTGFSSDPTRPRPSAPRWAVWLPTTPRGRTPSCTA